MENQFQKSLKQITLSTNKLLNEYAYLKEENKRLQTRLSDKDRVLNAQIDSIKELKNNYERLKIAHAFGMSEDSKKKAYLRITALVREIDKCIDLLNK